MRTCSVCDREYPRKDPWRCSCGAPLDYASQPLPDSQPAQFSRTSGVWAFADFLPMDERVSLGEGWTPLVDAPEWDASFKLEYLHPTGSFKDRGAATVIAEALGVGADRVLEDSSGNAGLAVASYAARAGLDAEIYVPASAKETKLRRIERTGANVVPIEGRRESVTAACIDAVENGAAGTPATPGTPRSSPGRRRPPTKSPPSETGACRTPSSHRSVTGRCFSASTAGSGHWSKLDGRTLSRVYWGRKRSGTVPSPTRRAVHRTTLLPTTSLTDPHPRPAACPASTTRHRRNRRCRRRRLRGGNRARARPTQWGRVSRRADVCDGDGCAPSVQRAGRTPGR